MQDHASLDQFSLLSVIGKGSYAKVLLVNKKKNPSQVYAMKILKKKYIEQKRQEDHVMTERNILTKMDHPGIVKLHHSFQDRKKLYFVLEYCPGGEFYGLLSRKQRLSETQAKFYACQLIMALDYLHGQNVIYRDLKPQNVLIDEKGYLRLTDFGLSRIGSQEQECYSVCGTPEYLAPEILSKTGHGKMVDWWCLGSLIYEMVVGLPPFYCKNRAELFTQIKSRSPVFPSYISQNLRNLLEGLLQKNPQDRLGSKNGAADLKNHQWLKGVDWQSIFSKNFKPPFVPILSSLLDVSNFDPEFTECEVHSYSQDSIRDSNLDDGKAYQDFSFDKSQQSKLFNEELDQLTSHFEMDIESQGL